MNPQKQTLHPRTNYLLATSIQFLLKSELQLEKRVHYIDLDLTKADSLENTLLTQFLEEIFFVRTGTVCQLFVLKSPYWLYIFFRVEANSTEIRTIVTSSDKCLVCCFKIYVYHIKQKFSLASCWYLKIKNWCWNLKIIRLLKKIQAFVEPEHELSHSHKSATVP
jgi:hypothetical protein